jgi:hypothetical protein
VLWTWEEDDGLETCHGFVDVAVECSQLVDERLHFVEGVVPVWDLCERGGELKPDDTCAMAADWADILLLLA